MPSKALLRLLVVYTMTQHISGDAFDQTECRLMQIASAVAKLERAADEAEAMVASARQEVTGGSFKSGHSPKPVGDSPTNILTEDEAWGSPVLDESASLRYTFMRT